MYTHMYIYTYLYDNNKFERENTWKGVKGGNKMRKWYDHIIASKSGIIIKMQM